MIYITGDIHGSDSIRKLNTCNFKEGKLLTKNDYVIICGDFGLLWNNTPDNEERYWLKWLDDKPWTTLFIEGNHENYNRLNLLTEIEMFDSVVGKVSDSVFHLKRGHVYEIDNKKVFCFGGATSIDKLQRTEGMSWWKEEVCNFSETEFAIKNLESCHNKIDIILTHTCTSLIKQQFKTYKQNICCPTEIFLDYVYANIDFDKWFCGHFHENTVVNRINFLYDKIVKENV